MQLENQPGYVVNRKIAGWLFSAAVLVFVSFTLFQLGVFQEAVGSKSSGKKISATEVATHAAASSCWTIIDGSVYDITPYVPFHPGGDDILLACGVDGSSLFNARTTAEGVVVGSGTGHDGGSRSRLDDYYIGELE